jgi:hypothetical protein
MIFFFFEHSYDEVSKECSLLRGSSSDVLKMT